jgi:glyoxylase-like metal-dependent hydrolase (beta-lactamase superfamily II)
VTAANIERVAPRVVRVRAPNPSPMTLDGTNTYLIEASSALAVAIDPGPPDAAHVASLVAVAREGGRKICAILVTHGHPDHAPGAALLHGRTGAPVYAHPAARFPHDVALADSEAVTVGDVAIEVAFAPGHARDHAVFFLPGDGALFSGDVVIGRGTVVVAPPGGDMRAYQTTLVRLRSAYGDASAILGGHGERVADAAEKLDAYIAHRKEREREILAAIETLGEATIPDIVALVYAQTPQVLWPAAARQVLAYLEALEREGSVASSPLERRLTAPERSILHPDLAQMVDEQSKAVARAELGFERDGAPIVAYRAARLRGT